jgi:hypothetical protein
MTDSSLAPGDVVEEWHRAIERDSLIEDLKFRIAEVKPRAEAAYAIWDRYLTELHRLECALAELLKERDGST